MELIEEEQRAASAMIAGNDSSGNALMDHDTGLFRLLPGKLPRRVMTSFQFEDGSVHSRVDTAMRFQPLRIFWPCRLGELARTKATPPLCSAVWSV